MESSLSPAERRELMILHWRDEVREMNRWAESALDEYLLAVKRRNRAVEMVARLEGQDIAS